MSLQTYFEKLLCEASQALHSARTSAATTSWVRQAVSGILTPGRSSVDPRLMDFNRAWVHQWMKTRNYGAWAELYPHPCLQEMLDKSQRVMVRSRGRGRGKLSCSRDLAWSTRRQNEFEVQSNRTRLSFRLA